MILEVIIKQPTDIIDYDIDATPIFNEDGSDFVTVVDTTVIPADACVATAVINGPDSVKVWLSGGVDGVTATVEVNVTTDAGRQKQDELHVKIKDFV